MTESAARMDGFERLAVRLQQPQPLIMGVLNVTPDSFSDGGRFLAPQQAVEQARSMVEAGADIIDIGGESTRPGAQDVPLDEERQRILPVIEALTASLNIPLSVDTSKPQLMAEMAALPAVGLINDVRALQAPGALESVAAARVHVCLMHMQGEPRTMQKNPYYEDVVREIGEFLAARRDACQEAGISLERIVVDPGFGFGKTLAHNLTLLDQLDALVARLGCPLLVGMSRKRMIGALLGDVPVDQRMHGSVAAALIAVLRGARIVRVHDVGPTRDALSIAAALPSQGSQS